MKMLALAFAALLVFACSDESDDGGGERSCGDGKCDVGTCESKVRCPEDCGTCIGSECQVGGPAGNCGESCSTSCDCINQGDFCSADYGVSPGTCVPGTCLTCSDLDRCMYTANADGRCASPTCT